MATCSTCGEAMLTERPHQHSGRTPMSERDRLAELLHRYGVGCYGRCAASATRHLTHADLLLASGVTIAPIGDAPTPDAPTPEEVIAALEDAREWLASRAEGTEVQKRIETMQERLRG